MRGVWPRAKSGSCDSRAVKHALQNYRTATHVYSPWQTGEFRYGFGNRATLQDVTDGDQIRTIRFGSTLYSPGLTSDTLAFAGTIIGTSTNVPINRRQRDHQLVCNHTHVFYPPYPAFRDRPALSGVPNER